MPAINQHCTVPPELAGERLDRAAAILFTDFSRVELTRWIHAGALTLDGRSVRPRERLTGGETIVLTAEREVREAWQVAQPMALSVLYEDDHLLVLNKPAGLVVHPGAGNPDQTLVNGLLHHRPALNLLARAGVVHRLDKDTSGVMVVAATAEAQLRLARMIARRQLMRRYVCICEGRMVAGRDVEAPIGRDPRVRTRQAVREDGKPARTEFRVRERYRAHTLVDAQLHTGRTHQIRVHMQSIGYPLVGDRRYGARGKVPEGATAACIETLHGFPRQALHAETLQFEHPVHAGEMEFMAPWPTDFQRLTDTLRGDAHGDA